MNQANSLASNRNQLLAALAPGDAKFIQMHLEPVSLELRQPLEAPNVPIEHVYFLESGIGSIVAISGQSQRIEAGIFGRDGMSGLAVVLGNDRTPNETYIQVAGSGLRIGADALRSAMQESPSLRIFFLHYVQASMLQTAHTALANGLYTIEERLARWLLMCHDRVDGDDLHLTHEFLALMLGVRRSGVTVATQVLEGQGLIKATRGLITVRDREGLEETADGCYGVPEAEYQRLMASLSAAATPA